MCIRDSANTALLIYCIMSFIMPGSDLMRKASAYVEPVSYTHLDVYKRQAWYGT